MLSHLRKNAVAYLALFLALGGTSYAAVHLKRGSVKTKHLHKNAVTNEKVKPNSLNGNRIRSGTQRTGAGGLVVRTGVIYPATTGPVGGSALCAASERAVSGGYEFPLDRPANATQDLRILSNRPVVDGAGSPVGWQVVLTQTGSSSISTVPTVYAVCMSLST